MEVKENMKAKKKKKAKLSVKQRNWMKVLLEIAFDNKKIMDGESGRKKGCLSYSVVLS